MIREHRFENREQLATRLAAEVAKCLRRAIGQRGRATLAVSGGSTPRPFFRALRSLVLAWEKVAITLTDERWVDPRHRDSNERMVRRELLCWRAAAARFLGLKTQAPTPEAGSDEVEPTISGLRPFDVVVLGMGDDGHTASLFPLAGNIGELLDSRSQRSVAAVRPAASPWPRLTLTLAALLDSERVFLHITGRDKWSTYRRASQAGPPEELPIRALLSGAVQGVGIFWAP